MDEALRRLVEELPKDSRRTLVMRLVKEAQARDEQVRAEQAELAEKAKPAKQWLAGLKRVENPEAEK